MVRRKRRPDRNDVNARLTWPRPLRGGAEPTGRHLRREPRCQAGLGEMGFASAYAIDNSRFSLDSPDPESCLRHRNSEGQADVA